MVAGPLRWVFPAALVALGFLCVEAQGADTFWATSLPNYYGEPSSLVFSNSGNTAAQVTLHDASGPVATVLVPPNASVPYELDAPPVWTTQVTKGGVHRAVSSEDVGVTLYGPMAGQWSNDATMVLPERLLRNDYRAFTYGQGSFVAALATWNNTQVTVTATANVSAGIGIPAMPAGSTRTWVLDHGEMLLLASDDDLTGTRVRSSRPVSVLAGSPCTVISPSACDHLEEQSRPIVEAGRTHVLCGTAAVQADLYGLVRVMATTPGPTTVTFSPAGPTIVLNGVGAVHETILTEDAVITSSQPVQVAAYLGTTYSGAADPAMVVLAPVEAWQRDHPVYVPEIQASPGIPWMAHVANVAAPTGTQATLDGAPLLWRQVTGTPYSCASPGLTQGHHAVLAPAGVSVQVLGFSPWQAAWHESLGLVPFRPPVPGMIVEAGQRTCLQETFHFDDDTDAPSLVVSWNWTFGDGHWAAGPSVVHAYTQSGTYTVRLDIVDTEGGTWTVQRDIEVHLVSPCPPRIDPLDLQVVYAGDGVHVCVRGHGGVGGPLAYTMGPAPEGAQFDPAGPCLFWTPTDDQEGTHPCIRFTVTEQPTGLSASTCLRIIVRLPRAPMTRVDRSATLDLDQDGVADSADNCPANANRDQADRDRDGIGDVCQTPCADGCEPPTAVGVRRPSRTGGDLDGDGVPDGTDLCGEVPDPQQADLDGDGIGDACDLDLDGDGIADSADICPLAPNPSQRRNACQAPSKATASTPPPAPRDPLSGSQVEVAAAQAAAAVGAMVAGFVPVLVLVLVILRRRQRRRR